jgi:hypothetical protein
MQLLQLVKRVVCRLLNAPAQQLRSSYGFRCLLLFGLRCGPRSHKIPFAVHRISTVKLMMQLVATTATAVAATAAAAASTAVASTLDSRNRD